MLRNHYSPSEFLKNVYSLLLTKVTMPQARFVRRPVYIRGRKSLACCTGLTTGRFCRFDLPGDKQTLFIGDNCEMGDMTHIVALNRVEIGKNVLIASKCFISDANHGSYKGSLQNAPSLPPSDRPLVKGSVKIGNNVWVGENAVILAGADIGDGCIIGANCIISKRIDTNSIVVGNNKVIKVYNNSTNMWEDVE